MQCNVCNKIILGAYVKDYWGNVYCVSHRDNLARCYACHRPISQKVTKGGSKYEDGRVICNLCRVSAVDRMALARSLLSEVQQRMTNYGIDTRSAVIPLQLVDVSWMTKGGVNVSQARTRGLVEKEILSRNGVEAERRIKAVSVLWGLPREQFEGVLSHELGHVWFFISNSNYDRQL